MDNEGHVQALEPPKALSNPSLLTLSGLYMTSKSVYSTYMPEAASKQVNVIAEKFIAASTPYVSTIHQKVLKGSTEEPKQVEEEEEKEMEPLSVDTVDHLLTNFCFDADARVEALLSTSANKVQQKVESVKTLVVTRVDAIKPAVQEKVESVKSVVHHSLENERIVQLKSRATDVYSQLTSQGTTCYTTVKEYTPAAKYLVVNAVGQLQLQVREQGAITSAKCGAHFLTDKAFEAIETMREQGPLTGAKTVVGTWSSGIAGLLLEAKAKLDAVEDEPSAVEDKEPIVVDNTLPTEAPNAEVIEENEPEYEVPSKQVKAEEVLGASLMSEDEEE